MSERVTVKKLKPISKAKIHDSALPTANSPWLGKDIKPKHAPSGIRTTVGVSTPGVFSARITRQGDTQVLAFNKGDPLVPGALYVFEFMVHHKDRINYSYDTSGGTIQVLRVEEIDASTAGAGAFA